MKRSHRLRAWLLNRQASALLRKARRPHKQSAHMIGAQPQPLLKYSRARARSHSYYLLLALAVVLTAYANFYIDKPQRHAPSCTPFIRQMT